MALFHPAARGHLQKTAPLSDSPAPPHPFEVKPTILDHVLTITRAFSGSTEMRTVFRNQYKCGCSSRMESTLYWCFHHLNLTAIAIKIWDSFVILHHCAIYIPNFVKHTEHRFHLFFSKQKKQVKVETRLPLQCSLLLFMPLILC